MEPGRHCTRRLLGRQNDNVPFENREARLALEVALVESDQMRRVAGGLRGQRPGVGAVVAGGGMSEQIECARHCIAAPRQNQAEEPIDPFVGEPLGAERAEPKARLRGIDFGRVGIAGFSISRPTAIGWRSTRLRTTNNGIGREPRDFRTSPSANRRRSFPPEFRRHGHDGGNIGRLKRTDPRMGLQEQRG